MGAEMKKYLIDYGDRIETVHLDSIKDVKNWLRHKLKKHRLHGIKISKVNNKSNGEYIKPVPTDYKNQIQCNYCKKYWPEEEITLDDEFIANFICESCLKHRKQII